VDKGFLNPLIFFKTEWVKMVIKSFFKAAFRQGKNKIENYVNDGADFTN
jgi:hypothetical protein